MKNAFRFADYFIEPMLEVFYFQAMEADLLLLHKFTLPFSIEVLYNPGVKKKIQIRVGMKYKL